MTKQRKIINRLYIQVSAIFLLVLLLFAAITIYISVNSARKYALEVNQKLNRDLAENTVDVIKPLFHNGDINQEAIADLMHSMMVINPSVEVYLLDPQGKILAYVAPKKVVKLEEVSLDPIHEFLDDTEQRIIYGDDPRTPGEEKIFSAARIFENNQLTGYIYIVLASQEYVSTSQAILGSYILGLSIRTMIVVLLISVLVGLLAIWLITKKLNSIISGIQHFKSGKLSTRIQVKNNNELDRIGEVFNEMADTIEKNIAELKGIDNLRKELIGNISHDLRTPIASIQGYAETLILKKDSLNEDDKLRYLQIIFNGSERLKKLVNDLFELSKLETDQVQLHTERFSIGELVHDVANKYRLLSQKQGISINTVVSKNIPLVEADISLIDRVLQNIIDNAIKFCKEGDYINLEIDTESPELVKVRIADSGKGIDQESLPHIFERYYKRSSSNGSSGLGLAIVKRIMDLHHTDINVYSELNQGTTFEFYLHAVSA